MANSNKNTQNPKENQNKMADEGIQEHSEHTAENKQPESEENAAKNDEAAKQAEMKQADTVVQPKEQIKLTDVLEVTSKILGISAIFGIFIGGITIYSYLLNIGQLSIFPDVIASAANLLTISISFGIIFLIFYVLLYFIFCLANSEGIKNIPLFKLDGIFIIILLYVIIYLISIFLDIISFSFSNFVVFCFVAFVFSLIAYLSSKIFKKNFFIVYLPINAFIILILMFHSEKAKVLYPIHYVEFHSDSSWYLLHNNFQQNNGSQEANGIDKNDLLKLKQKFKCSILSEKEKAEKGITCSPETRNNALFGYMAWNLGDTKVFCPPTVYNIIRNEEEKEKLGKECIVISGKALQIMPESYISTNTDGIDESNPDNTGHGDPAIDINTDVRFKNDLNAQSNAGLNNFNVQPVLPIQSNAKNMSIQIHYGSCNHDSPRNKDSHPDIGYTDKKICQ